MWEKNVPEEECGRSHNRFCIDKDNSVYKMIKQDDAKLCLII